MSLGENIAKLRSERNLTQEELGSRIGLQKQNIYSYEKGVKVPTVERLVLIADALHCTTDELLGRNVS